jgi:hypothetical protein
VEKMNKTIGAFILIFLVLFPGLALSQYDNIDNPLDFYGLGLNTNYLELENIFQDLEVIAQTCECTVKEFHALNYSLLDILYIKAIIIYESDQLQSAVKIKEEFKKEFYDRKKKFLEIAKGNINGGLEHIQKQNADVNNNEALLLLKKSRDIIRDSIKTIDVCIDLLEKSQSKIDPR